MIPILDARAHMIPILDAHCPILDAHCPIPDAHCPIPDAHCPIPDAHCLMVSWSHAPLTRKERRR
jgi:hypothetical protein